MDIILRKEAKAQGLKRYFTGKPCKWGHVDWRNVSDKTCNKCTKLRLNVWRKANKERDKNRKRKWALKNRPRINKAKNKQVNKLSDYYVKHRIVKQFNLTIDQITPEMIEMKRNLLLQHRRQVAINKHVKGE